MGRNGIDLTEADDIKKRWQEYTELYKRDLHDPNNSAGIPSPPLALFIVMLPKAHLTSDSKILALGE